MAVGMAHRNVGCEHHRTMFTASTPVSGDFLVVALFQFQTCAVTLALMQAAGHLLSALRTLVHKGTTATSCHNSSGFQKWPDLHAVCRLLCEVHEEYETNIKLAKEGYFVYDFALPLLLLHAFTFHTAENIANWLRICPRRQITVLDTHDGMGIDDISGLASVSTSTCTSVLG
jgi:hypothetical protein